MAKSLMKKNARFIFSESPANPYRNILDLVKSQKIADEHKLLARIDSTFDRRPSESQRG
jgi:cystathionine gamma-synthase